MREAWGVRCESCKKSDDAREARRLLEELRDSVL
jgi:hypothetical protein